MANNRALDRAVALTRDIIAAEDNLALKRAELAKLLGVKSVQGLAGSRVSGDQPISQRVLEVVAQGPRTRGEIIQAIGGHEAAVTSALKKHKATGKLTHADGKYGPVTPKMTMPTPVQVRKGNGSK